MFKAFIQIVAMAALALVCGTGYNLYNLSNKDPRAMTWVMDERLRGMDLLASSAPETKAVQPPANPAPPSTPQDAKKPGDPLPSDPQPPKEKEAPPAQIPQLTAKAPEPTKDAAPASEFPMIDIAAAHEEYGNETLFIDARRTREYEAGHITGAQSASAWETQLLEKITKIREEYPAEAPIVVYCGSSKECEDSKIVSRQLKEVGFLNILVYQGGFPEWSKEKPDLVTKGLEPGKREVP
jgi:rhodanese-related sulfurtransferase